LRFINTGFQASPSSCNPTLKLFKQLWRASIFITGLKSGVNDISRHTAFSIAPMDEALLRIAPAKLNYVPKNFFVKISVTPWPGVVAQCSAHSNTDSGAKEEVVFSSF
jgi:hypothetical protein